MNPRDLDANLIDSLRRDTGVDDIEVFVKRGRSRRFVRQAEREIQVEADEQGWAVRASTSRASFFATGTGEPGAMGGWLEPDGYPVAFPGPSDSGDLPDSAQSAAPLASDSELRALARTLVRELDQAMPRARLDLLVLEDGQSNSRVGNSNGVLCGWRTRAASLTLEASLSGERRSSARVEWVRGELREMSPSRLAARLADLLAVDSEGRSVVHDRCEVVAAPEVATRLIAGLMPLFTEASCGDLVSGFGGPDRLGSSLVTLIDDGRLRGGVLASSVDGEGTPTREVTLMEQGSFRQPLLPWWSERPGCRSGGCCRRDSWRDQPRVGVSHLYLRPDTETRAAEMVGSLSRGYYLLDAPWPGSFDFADDRFALPVRGFELQGGRARMPVTGVQLVGKISSLLRGVRAVARDLTFVRRPIGLVGSPTVRLSGLELHGS